MFAPIKTGVAKDVIMIFTQLPKVYSCSQFNQSCLPSLKFSFKQKKEKEKQFTSQTFYFVMHFLEFFFWKPSLSI